MKSHVLLFLKVIKWDGSPVFCWSAGHWRPSRKAGLQGLCWHRDRGCPVPAIGRLQKNFQHSQEPGFLLHTHFQHCFLGRRSYCHGAPVSSNKGAILFPLLDSLAQIKIKGKSSWHTIWPRFPLESRNRGAMQHRKIGKGFERGLNGATLPRRVRSSLLDCFCQETRQKKKSGR